MDFLASAFGHSLRKACAAAAFALIITSNVMADSVTPLTLLEGPAAGADSVVLVKSNASATWGVTANTPWLHVASSTGSYAVNHLQPFTFDANPGSTRIGTLTVDGTTITVTQLGSTYVPTTAAPALLTRADFIRAMTVDQAGNLYFSDGSIIEKWTAATNTVSTIVSSGIVLTLGITVDSAGNLYIADTNASKVLKWTAATNTLSTLVSTGLSAPITVALDPAGNLYIADYYTIWKRPAAGGPLTQGFTSAKTAEMAFDAKGSLYISTNDGQPGTPRMIKKGTPGNTDAPIVNLGQVVNPYGVALDPSGNLLIADYGNGTPEGPACIRQWSPATAPTTNTVILSDLGFPARIAVNNQGTVYLSDFIDSTHYPLRAKPRAFIDTHGTSVPLAGGAGSLPAVLPTTTFLTGSFAPTADQAWITLGSISNGVISFTASATGTTRYGYVTVLGQKMLVQQGTPAAPTLITPTSANITVISATLGGNITADGGSPVVARGVVISATADNPNPLIFGTSVTKLTDTNTGTGTFTVNATGLLSNTSYTYRAYVTTAYGGTSYTAPTLFTTQTATLATLAAPTVTNLGNDTATLNGNITDGGNTTVSARGLVYSLTSQNSNPEIGGANVTVINDASGGTGAFSADISGLAYSTGYSFKAFATNVAGTAYSTVTSFTTLDPTYKLGTSSLIEGSAAGTDSIVFGVTPATAPWTASSNATWLHLSSTSGTGSALITFTFDENIGATRSGTLTIGGQTLTVTQATVGYNAVKNLTQLGTNLSNACNALVVDSNGNVFTNPTNGQLVKWSPSTNTFSNVAAVGSTNAMATDAAGNVYLSDLNNRRILKWAAPSGPVTTVATNVRSFYGLAVDSKGNLWTATLGDNNGDGLKKVTPSGTVTLVYPTTGVAGGVAIDAADNVYWIDNETYFGVKYLRVYKRDSNTGNVSLLIPTGDVTFSTGLAVDGSGNLWVLNSNGGVVYKWTSITNTLAPVLSGIDSSSSGLATDRAGNVYVADNAGNRIVELPRVFISSSALNLPTSAGTGQLPVVIPNTSISLAPFTPSAGVPWLHIDSNTLGTVSYSYDVTSTPRFGYLIVAGQSIFVQQGTPVVPTVTTPTSTSVTSNSATIGGNVTNDGGGPLVGRGVVLALASANANPELGGTGVVSIADGANVSGVFTASVSGLSPNTTYAFKAYATNKSGTSYSSVGTFLTAALEQSSYFAGGVISAIALQPDGKLIVGGNSAGLGILRFDTSENVELLLSNIGGTTNCFLALDNSKIVVAGSFNSLQANADPSPTTRNNIGLINTDGSVDSSFNPNVNGAVTCMALQKDGSILIGGSFTQVGGIARNRIARLYSNGTLDLTFNPSANGTVRSIAVQADGKVLLGGDFTLIGTNVCNRIARVSTLGVVDTTFFASADASVNVLALQPDNSILVGGIFATINNIAHANLARLNPNGSLDNGFTTTANGAVNSIALQADGKVIVGGGFTSVAGTARLGFARLFSGGGVDAINADVTGTVNLVMLREDGKIIIGGDISQVSGTQVNSIAKLANDAISQTLEPTGSTSIEWLRGGTLPEAIDVAFDLSTDGGNTWTFLGNGARNNGGWGLGGIVPMPAAGQLRGRARILSGQGNGSMGWNIVEAPFSLAPPQIAVDVLADNGDHVDVTSISVNLLSSGVGVAAPTTFFVRNSGGYDLTGITATILNDKGTTDASMFSIPSKPATVITTGDSASMVVQAKLTSQGEKKVVLKIESAGAVNSPVYVPLVGFGVPASIPAVSTGSGTASYNTAHVIGSSSGGSNLNFTFDYGLTTAYTDEVDAILHDGEPIHADLVDLLPHKTYHYRLHASSPLGSGVGADKTFTTLNHAPVANPDSAVLLPGAVASIDVLANDTDVDDDPLTITTTKPVSPLTAGTVAITGNQLVFTAKDTFTGTATVDYSIKDGFGGTATGTLTITAGGTPTLTTSQTMPLSSAAITYPLTITTAGSWSVSESLSWASVSQTKGTGTTTVQISVLDNASTAQRSGDIKIGGVIHHVVQNGVVKPTFGTLSGSPFNAIVGGSFQLALPIQNAPVTYTTTGLPPGLTLSNTTNTITGRPTMTGTTATNYTVVVKASNAAGPLATDTAGKAAATLSFVIHVDPLPTAVIGMFSGYIDRSPSVKITTDSNLGSRFDMTTTAVGTVTGSVTEGATKKSFTGGQIIAALGTPNTYSLTVALTGTPLFLDITFDADHNKATGVLRDVSGLNRASLYAWRSTWNPLKATIYKAQHNFRLRNTSTSAGPQGYGFGSFIVTESTGALAITGKLPDGSALATSTFVGPAGDVLLYQSLHANHGTCFGLMTIGTNSGAPLNNTVSGTLTWGKPASAAALKDTVYAAGFPVLPLEVLGGTFNPPSKGGLLVASVDQADNAQLSMGTAGTDTPTSPLLRISNPNTSTGTTNVAKISSPNPDNLAMPVLTFGTGAFNGSFTLAGTPARPATFFGQIVPISGIFQGYGYYLLPSVPGMGQTVATSPKFSGTVWLISH